MAYLYLGFAIIGELIGTTCLKYADGFTKLLPTFLAIAAYVTCFFFLSKSLKYINLSVVYASWSGIGIVAATLLSVFMFKEQINLISIVAIIMIISGVVTLNLFGSAH